MMGVYRRLESGATNSLKTNRLITHWDAMSVFFPEYKVSIDKVLVMLYMSLFFRNLIGFKKDTFRLMSIIVNQYGIISFCRCLFLKLFNVVFK